MKLLQVVCRHRQGQRLSRRNLRQKIRIWRIPRIAYCQFVNDLESWRLVVHKKVRRDETVIQLLVEMHILQRISKILRSQQVSVRPAMTWPDVEGKYPVLLNLKG